MNDEIKEILNDIRHTLDVMFFMLLLFTLGSCYVLSNISSEIEKRKEEKQTEEQTEVPVEQIREDFKNEHFPAE